MAVDDVWKLTLLQSYEGQQVQNSLAFIRVSETEVSQSDAQTLANEWKDIFKAQSVAQLSHTGWRLQQLRGGSATYPAGLCRRVGGGLYEGTHTGIVVGANAGEGLPPQCSMVVTLKSGESGRSKRGRVYQNGLGEAQQINGRFLAATITGSIGVWAPVVTKYVNPASDLLWRLGIWSQTIATGCKPSTSHPHPMITSTSPAPEQAFTPCTSIQVRDIVYSQRRRTIGVGR